ncbi:MAG TPA: ectonucleotide pyrophosphatase/phosphodiesterase [Thermoanaerobaculia bacterium]|nr:ectonucleotide pyrophosphatase/phosphodiesterase [Thermoanaerobaculia bacterium]
MLRPVERPLPRFRRHLRGLSCLLLSAAALVGCVGRGAPAPPSPAATGPGPPSTLILISIDGFRWDYLGLHPAPVLERLAAEGVRARALVPVFPTKTFPNHYTLVTGLYPERHGIVSNTMLDPEDGAWFRLSDREAVQSARWWQGEPIWVTAERQGLRAATLFWPGSEAPIGGVRPSRWLAYDEEMTPRARVDRVLGWLDLPAASRPSLVTLYFEQVDDAGHDFGPRSPQTAAAVAAIDAEIGRLVHGLEMRGILDRVDLVLVSDHGMTELAADRVVVLEDLVDPDDVQAVAVSTFAMLRPRPGREQAVYEALRAAPPQLQIHRREEVPERLRYRDHRRITPLVVLADEGWYLYTTHQQARSRRLPAGMHGYDPELRSMHGLFVARGPSFRSGLVVDEVRSIDLYALMTAALGLAPAPHQGDHARVAGLLADHTSRPPPGFREVRARRSPTARATP